MSIQINGNYNRSQASYAEQLKEKQSLARAEKAEQAKKGQNDEKVTGRASVSHDEYVSSEKSSAKPSGLYRIGKDENGNQKVFYDAPGKTGAADKEEQPKVKGERIDVNEDGKRPKADADNSGKPVEKCTGNTDGIDKEIERLKEKRQQLKQQIQSASGDEQKMENLERKLAQVESELSQKDNDAYRRQHTFFS